MKIATSRFGEVEIRDDRVINFRFGLLGFHDFTQFCLIEPADDACFFWLQSTQDAELAFVVTDPMIFEPSYQVAIRPAEMREIGLAALDDAQVFVVVNKIDRQLTGNLQGPIVINTLNREAKQLVLADRQWTVRHPLMKVGAA